MRWLYPRYRRASSASQAHSIIIPTPFPRRHAWEAERLAMKNANDESTFAAGVVTDATETISLQLASSRADELVQTSA